MANILYHSAQICFFLLAAIFLVYLFKQNAPGSADGQTGPK